MIVGEMSQTSIQFTNHPPYIQPHTSLQCWIILSYRVEPLVRTFKCFFPKGTILLLFLDFFMAVFILGFFGSVSRSLQGLATAAQSRHLLFEFAFWSSFGVACSWFLRTNLLLYSQSLQAAKN